MYTVLSIAGIVLALQLFDDPFLLLIVQLLAFAIRLLGITKGLAQSHSSHDSGEDKS